MKKKNLLNLIVVSLMLVSVWPTSLANARELAPASLGSGQITVHKFEDVNENGVQDESEQDVEGWLFRLYSLDGGLREVGEGHTDADGNLVFDGLPSGGYKVWEECRECWKPITPPDMNDWNGGYYTVVDLSEGQYITVDFGNAHDCVFPPDSFVDVEKYVSGDGENWYDADTQAEALEVSVGGDVYFRFLVSNIGDGALYNLILSDDVYDVSGCTLTDPLVPGASFECVIGAFSAEEGWHMNTAAAAGVYAGETHIDTDVANYIGREGGVPSIDVEKLVSIDGQTWDDADEAPGPEVLAGENVWFRFVVTNDGTEPLTDVTLVDSDYDVSTCEVPVGLAPGEMIECEIGPLAAEGGQHTNTATATGNYGGETYSDGDDANYFGVAPSIDVEKQVSVDGQTWEDADEAPGPEVLTGESIWFRFVVSNDGTETLTDVTLTDSDYEFSYEMSGALEPNESFIWGIGPSAAEAGQHTNTATARGSYGGEVYSDTDDANYFGVTLSIDVEKQVSVDGQTWEDADEMPGPEVLAGEDVWFRFVVINDGTVTLADISLVDGDYELSCEVPGTLAPDGSFMCEIGPLAAEAGQHTNTATATGSYGGEIYSDTDDANYFGVAPSIDVEKYVSTDGQNWEDADEAPGPEVFAGEDVWFRFVVTNDGTVTLADISLVDSDYELSCEVPVSLAPDGSFTCEIGPLATEARQHTNTVTATGSYDGEVYSDTDDANYFGVAPSIDVEKYVSVDGHAWEDADEAPGPEVSAGEDVWFRFVVTNDGTEPLTVVTLRDSDYSFSYEMSGALAPDDSFTYNIGPLAAETGQHSNTATATGEYEGEVYSDTDDANYFGVRPVSEATELTLDPDDATNELPTETSHEFTATVLDQYGDPMEGVTVSFSTDFGQFAGDDQHVEVESNAFGEASVTITSIITGTAHIRAWVDDGDGIYTVGEVTDEPSTKQWTGEGPTSLVVTKTVGSLWERTYDWSIIKAVDPVSMELALEESSDITYTIKVVRSESDSYTIQGTVYAQNDVENAAHVLSVEDAVEYQLSTPGSEWIELTRETIAGESWIPADGLMEWEYNFSFEPVGGASYRNVVYVTLANHFDGEHTFLYSEPFELPGTPTGELDECAVVTDVQGEIPEGFSLRDDYPDEGWEPCASATFMIHKTLTNTNAVPGTYELDNTAMVVEGDTDDSESASATITIIGKPSEAPSAEADLDIRMSYRTNFVSSITYFVVARNLGPEDAPGAVISDTFPTRLNSINWTCEGEGGASCPSNGSGDVLYETLSSFPSGGVVTYTIRGRFDDWSFFANVVSLMPPVGVSDPDMSNNTARAHRYMLLLPLVFKNSTFY